MPYVFNPLPIRFDKTSSVAAGGGVTQVTTDDGVITPSSGNINVLADDTTADNPNGITVDGNTANTATILITNRVQDTGSTSGAVTDDLQLVDFTSFTDGCYTFTIQVSAFDSTTPSAGSYILNGGVMSISGTPTIIDTNFSKIVNETAAIADADANAFISGNILYIQVTGAAGLNINWGMVGTYSRSV